MSVGDCFRITLFALLVAPSVYLLGLYVGGGA